MTSPGQFLPPPPPALDSQAYADAVNKTESLGAADSTTRTADQTQIARFWADGAGTYTPPGAWNQIAEDAALATGDSLAQDAQLFAELNVAEADSAIAAWNTKFTYNTWRPITVIQNGDSFANAGIVQDPNWQPLLLTPNFPEYISGHSTFSAAAAEVLTQFFGTDYSFSTTSTSLPGVTRSFASFWDAAQEAGESRIYGGIHFEFANQEGLATGQSVADLVLASFDPTKDTTPPRILLDQASGGTAAQPPVLTGEVTDNLSGVAALSASLDGGTPFDVPIANGAFSLAVPVAADGSADGAHRVSLVAIDAAGNATLPLNFDFTLDTRAPVIELAPASIQDGGTLDLSSHLAGTADPTGSPLVALSYRFDDGVVVPIAFDPATGTFDAALDLTRLGTGAHTLTLRATDAAGNVASQTLALSLPVLPPLTITSITPTDGADDVGVTYRPMVTFSRPVDLATLTGASFFATDAAGAAIPATIVPLADATGAWLFFSQAMPGGSTVTLHLDGNAIKGLDGQPLDADGGGTPGGLFTESFTTVGTAAVPGTTISGRVVDPGTDLQPMTFDDVRAGPDQILHTADDVYLNPIAHAKVFILGRESEAVFTDALGNFTLTSVPSGDVKVVVDGRTATNAPAGIFYPEMVMDTDIKPGVANTIMGSMGDADKQSANVSDPSVYLPRLSTTILQPLSATAPTVITAPADSGTAATIPLTAQQLGELTLTVQPGSLVDAGGNPVQNPQVGISLVPPSLVADMLPPGVLQHTFDITIQAPNGAVFTTPAQLTMPNVFGAAPGTKLDILSFDHTTGRLVIDGTGTVSADGLTVTSDPGAGVTMAGWHGLTPPGGSGGSGGAPLGPPTPTPNDTFEEHDTVVEPMMYGEDGSFELIFTAPSAPGTRFVQVTIDIDGPLSDFMKQAGSLPLINQTFTLAAGSGETKTFEAVAKTLDELFPSGLGSVSNDILYGSEIKVTQVSAKTDGSNNTVVDTYDLYRFVNAVEPIQDPSNQDINFEQDLVGTTHEEDLDVRAGNESKPKVDLPQLPRAFEAEIGGNNFRLTFTPTDKSRTAVKGALILTNNRGKPIPNPIILAAKPIREDIFLNINLGPNSLDAFLNGRRIKLESQLKVLQKTNPSATLADLDPNADEYSKANLPKLEAAVADKLGKLFLPYGISVFTDPSLITPGQTQLVDFGPLTVINALGTSGPAGGVDNFDAIRKLADILKITRRNGVTFPPRLIVNSLANVLNQNPPTGFVLEDVNALLDELKEHLEQISQITGNKVGPLSQDHLAEAIAQVAAHEVGHTLSLVHSNVSGDVMLVGSKDTHLEQAHFLPGVSNEPLLMASGNPVTTAQGLAAAFFYENNLSNDPTNGPLQPLTDVPIATVVTASQTGTSTRARP